MYEIKVRQGAWLYPMVIAGGRLALRLSFRFNAVSGRWLMDVSSEDGRLMLSALPLIPAQDILGQFSHLGIGSAWVVPVKPGEELKAPVEDSFDSGSWALLWGDAS